MRRICAGQAGVKAIEVCLTMRQLRLIYMGFTAPGLRLASGPDDIQPVLEVRAKQADAHQQ
jgi:hypothetical protein